MTSHSEGGAASQSDVAEFCGGPVVDTPIVGTKAIDRVAGADDSGRPAPAGNADAVGGAAVGTIAEIVHRLEPAPSFVLRAFEVVVATLALLVGLPIMLVVALIVRLDSPGPVLFFQARLGLGGRHFRFVKFRTMYADARQRFPELYAYRYDPVELETLKFKVDADPRVTRAGTWLRRSSLDELPNFWNVLTGDMALVGPRPEIPEMLPYYHGEMLAKFTVRPGVTGLAQISGRGRLSFFETVDFDLKYVRTRSFWLDVKIMVETVRKVLMSHGAF